MKDILDIHDLLVEQLRELNDAEQALIEALPAIESRVWSSDLREILTQYHHQVIENQMTLIQVFHNLFTLEKGERSMAIRHMIKQSYQLLETCQTPEVSDAAIILLIQQMIHFKIASYGAVCTYAKIIGVYKDGQLLHDLLKKEKRMDSFLVSLADTDIDRKAYNYSQN
ncbi:MAG: DUF892 family protein [Marinoscillum sp.]